MKLYNTLSNTMQPSNFLISFHFGKFLANPTCPFPDGREDHLRQAVSKADCCLLTPWGNLGKTDTPLDGVASSQQRTGISPCPSHVLSCPHKALQFLSVPSKCVGK